MPTNNPEARQVISFEEQEQALSQIAICLRNHNFTAIDRITNNLRVRAAARLGAASMTVEQRLDLPLVDTNLWDKWRNMLEEHGITTVRDVAEMSRSDIMSLRNFGRAAADDIAALLEELGISGKAA